MKGRASARQMTAESTSRPTTSTHATRARKHGSGMELPHRKMATADGNGEAAGARQGHSQGGYSGWQISAHTRCMEAESTRLGRMRMMDGHCGQRRSEERQSAAVRNDRKCIGEKRSSLQRCETQRKYRTRWTSELRKRLEDKKKRSLTSQTQAVRAPSDAEDDQEHNSRRTHESGRKPGDQSISGGNTGDRRLQRMATQRHRAGHAKTSAPGAKNSGEMRQRKSADGMAYRHVCLMGAV